MVPDKVERLLQRAQQAIAGRDWEKAKQLYLAALGLRSDVPDIHYGLATVFFQLREMTSAAHHFREVIRLDPHRAGAHVNLGAVLNLLGQLDDAVTALRRALQIDPSRVEAYYNLGLVYRRKGQADLAAAAYKEALRHNPRMADAHLNLGNLLLDKGQFRQAAGHYELALQIRPGWDKATVGLDHARDALEAPADPAGADSLPAAADDTASYLPIDPKAHGAYLGGLNHTAGVCGETAQLVQKILVDEVVPGLNGLSHVLLRSGSRGELDASLSQFEAALHRLRTTRQTIQSQLARLQAADERFPTA